MSKDNRMLLAESEGSVHRIRCSAHPAWQGDDDHEEQEGSEHRDDDAFQPARASSPGTLGLNPDDMRHSKTILVCPIGVRID